MTKTLLSALAAALLLPAAVMAQGTVPGAEVGARDGAAARTALPLARAHD